MNRSAFTLVEVLITISIIGVLAALALPGFKTARAKAKSAQCQSNMRQIGVAMAGYAGDNNQELPRAYNNTTETTTWMQKLAPYAGIGDNRLGPYPLLRATGIFLCPEFHPAGREVAFALNSAMDPTSSFTKWNYRSLNVPAASTIVVVEVAYNADTYSPSSNGDVARRHPLSSANYLFVDGHVENIKEVLLATDARWFRER